MKNTQDKILIVTDYYYPHWTGLSKALEYFINPTKKTFAFTVLTIKLDKRSLGEQVIKGVKVFRENYIFSLSRAKYSLAMIVKLIKIVRDFDTVIINCPSVQILPVAFIVKLFKKKLIIFHQGDLILPEGLINKCIEIVFDFSTMTAMVMAYRVGTYTEDYANNSRILPFFRNKFSAVIPVVPNYNDARIIPMNQELDKVIKAHVPVFGFAGRFVKEKGFDLLFRAIPQIVTQLPNAKFVFAGELNMGYENFFEECRDEYEKIKEHLIILGRLKSEKLASFYRIIDAVIVPSRSDCFNLVQAEAMLAGVPAIVADIPGARYLVDQSGLGMKFRPGDVNDLAEKVVSVYKRKKQIKLNYSNLLRVLDENKLKFKIEEFLKV